MDSKTTIYQLQKGSYTIFKEVYEQWKSKVFYYFLSKTNDEDTAKDLTQNTFIKLWEYRAAVDCSISLEQQIFKKARYIFIDHLRKSANERRLIQEQFQNKKMDENCHAYELRQMLRHAIDTLPSSRKKIFELKYIEGYSYKEIAEQLCISPKTVDNQLLKAIKHMKNLLCPREVTSA